MTESLIKQNDAQNFCIDGIHYVLDGKVTRVQDDEFNYMRLDLLALILPNREFYGELKKSFNAEDIELTKFNMELNAIYTQLTETFFDIKDNGGLVMIPDAFYFEQKYKNIKHPDFLKLRKEFRDVVRKCIAGNYKEAEGLIKQGHRIAITEKTKYTQQKVAEEITGK